MIPNISLRIRLMTGVIGLVFFSIIFISILFYYQFNAFGKSTLSITQQALKEQALNLLQAGVKYDREIILNLIINTINDANRLATSSNTCGYFSAIQGDNEILNSMVENEAKNTVSGLLNICRLQQGLFGKKLDENLAVTEYVLLSKGEIKTSNIIRTWDAINSFTGEKKKFNLPVLTIGSDLIGLDEGAEKNILNVINELTGASFTIFQKINDNWDMLSILTNIKNHDNQFMTANYMPGFVDGDINPVIEIIKNGAIFKGRTEIMGKWYIGAYKPLRTSDKTIIGMIFVGIQEQNIIPLKNAIFNVKIGKTGYGAVMDSTGKLIIHPRDDLVNLNVITDLHLDPFQEVLDYYTIRKTGIISYIFEDRKKFLAYTYLDSWDWIILATGYWDEFFQEETARQLLQNEMQTIFDNAGENILAKSETVYSQIKFIGLKKCDSIFLDKHGFTLIKTSLEQHFKPEIIEYLKTGKTYFSEIDSTSKGDFLAIAVPVFLQNILKGAIVIEFNWSLVWNILKDRIYGKTGYAYIIDDKGTLVSHPKYSLKDNVNLGYKRYGDLAQLVNDEMRQGKKGHGVYTFEGVKKYVSFLPFIMGDKIYSIAVTSPVDEFFRLSQTIEKKAALSLTNGVKKLGLLSFIFMGISACIAFYTGNKIILPIIKIIQSLSKSADQITKTNSQLADVSHQSAKGAEQQAASLEQTVSSLEQMSVTIHNNADNALKANNFMQENKKIFENASELMYQLVEYMNTISETGKKTSNIIQTSEDIAFQTNLLALNAAIEAARAGKNGAGFAVVADEVRQLAMQAADASQNTSKLIQTIVNQVNKAVDLVQLNNENFVNIVSSASKTSTLVKEISFASSEQAKNIEQLNQSVFQMDKVTQNNASSAVESAEKFDKIRNQAYKMETIVKDLEKLVYGKK